MATSRAWQALSLAGRGELAGTVLGAGQAEIERRCRILLHVAVAFLFFFHYRAI